MTSEPSASRIIEYRESVIFTQVWDIEIIKLDLILVLKKKNCIKAIDSSVI